MALQIKSIADAICGLTVTGLDLRTLAQLNKWDLTGPTFYPDPQDFVTNFLYTRDSEGSNVIAKGRVDYDLNFAFAFAKVGHGYGIWDIYDPMVTLFGQLMDVLITSEIPGAQEFHVTQESNFGPITLPNDTLWHGCKIAVHVMEFVN